MSNLGLERALEAQGIALVRTPVGDRYVVEAMRKGGFNLGRRAVGPPDLPRPHLDRRRPDRRAAGAGPDDPHRQAALRAGARGDGARAAGARERDARRAQAARGDGGACRASSARIRGALGKDGRVLVRWSGTEPKLRVMVEGAGRAADRGDGAGPRRRGAQGRGLEAAGLYSSAMPALAVNIDHVVTVRQARRAKEPDPVHAAVLAELGGASAISVHLRADRRHVQDRDVEVLRQTVRKRGSSWRWRPAQEMLRIALTVKPNQVTLVPERREELTTEGGLDVVLNSVQIRPMVKTLQDAGIDVALFVEPELEQIKEAHKLGARVVESLDGGLGRGRGRPLARERAAQDDRRRAARAQAGLRGARRPRAQLRQRGADRRAERDRRDRGRPRDRGPLAARGHGARGARDGRNPALGAGGTRLTRPGEPLMLGALR